MTDEEKKIKIKKFSEKICPIIQEFKKEMPEIALAAYLIHVATELDYERNADYYMALGMLFEKYERMRKEIKE